MPYVEDKLEDLHAKCQEHRHIVQPIPKYYLKVSIVFLIYRFTGNQLVFSFLIVTNKLLFHDLKNRVL